MFMKKLFLLLPLLFLYIALPGKTWAQSTPQQFLTVSPVIEDLQLTPGHPTKYTLTITNKGDKPVGFHIEATGIDPTSDDGSQNLTQLSSPLLSWLSITPHDLIVVSHDKATFQVTINTPKQAKTSGYYATLFLTPFISNPLRPNGPVILERIGTLLLATVGDLNYDDLAKKVAITDFGFQSKNMLSFSVQNSYFTHFTAKPRLVMTSLLDKEIVTFPQEKHVLPASKRTWQIPLHAHWYTIYTNAHLSISIGNGKQLVAQTTYINYQLLISIVLGICFVLLILRRRKQLILAITILLTGHK